MRGSCCGFRAEAVGPFQRTGPEDPQHLTVRVSSTEILRLQQRRRGLTSPQCASGRADVREAGARSTQLQRKGLDGQRGSESHVVDASSFIHGSSRAFAVLRRRHSRRMRLGLRRVHDFQLAIKGSTPRRKTAPYLLKPHPKRASDNSLVPTI